MGVPEETPAETENHRPMPSNQRSEGGFAGVVLSRCEPLQQVAVGQTAERSDVKQHAHRLGEHS